ncbi:IS66 family transposase zinc-finger binding domain-containing protein [Leptospira kirschneri]|uniref:IS66 family transposase zinc-finger binding domain-containing protein n=1 Tax=Leptospira kirschneri TaxID=29507 RepID=UPI0002DBB1E1|nr:IS66 family transposase zinc-finger binding domain-containing protein [Leptospira kirschneri]
MSLDPNALPDDVEELKRIIILENQEKLKYQEELLLQKQEYSEELKLLKQKESEHLDQIERLKIQLFGRRTEKWSQIEKDQGLLFDEIESSLQEDVPEPESLFTPVKSHTREKTGRKPFPDYFPRIETLHDISEAEKTCACGHTLSRIGEEKSEKLDIIPAKVQVEVHISPKYACKHCEGTSDRNSSSCKDCSGSRSDCGEEYVIFRILSLHDHSKVRGRSSVLQTSGNSPEIGSGSIKKRSFQRCNSSV